MYLEFCCTYGEAERVDILNQLTYKFAALCYGCRPVAPQLANCGFAFGVLHD